MEKAPLCFIGLMFLLIACSSTTQIVDRNIASQGITVGVGIIRCEVIDHCKSKESVGICDPRFITIGRERNGDYIEVVLADTEVEKKVFNGKDVKVGNNGHRVTLSIPHVGDFYSIQFLEKKNRLLTRTGVMYDMKCHQSMFD